MDQVDEKPTTGVAHLKRISKFEGMELVHQLSTCFHTISSFFFNEHISSIEFQFFYIYLCFCIDVQRFRNSTTLMTSLRMAHAFSSTSCSASSAGVFLGELAVKRSIEFHD